MNQTKTLDMRSKGYYSLTVLDENGNEKPEKSVSCVNNVITFAGAFASLMTTIGPFNSLYAAIGTGSTEILRSAANLGAEDPGRTSGVGSTRAGNETDNLDGTSTVSLTRTFSFGLGTKVGTFSEVGLFSSSSGGVFVAGQLIKDEFGNPTTITLLASEQLVITYTLDWVVPNTSNLVGTGTVTDDALNSYNYEVWAQPYFNQYTVGTANNANRYNPSNGTGDEVVFRKANGITSTGANLDSGSPISVVHDGSGTVTFTASPNTFSPGSMNIVDCVFVGFYYYSSLDSRGNIVDTVNVLGAEATSGTAPSMYIKFLTPFTKGATESFTISATMTVSI